jgi:integrase
MPRKPKNPSIMCEFFTWNLFQRDRVYYADGRRGRFNLGKQSLNTRDYGEAVENLRQLDRQIAIRRGLVAPSVLESAGDVSMPQGWDSYLAHCQRPEVVGGVSPGTVNRYRSVRDKHVAFCGRQDIMFWHQINRANVEGYAKWLEKERYFPRTLYLELTLIKSVVLWLIDEGLVPPTCKLRLELAKPQGTDTYCYTRDQVAAMVSLCRSMPALTWLGDVLVALTCTGLRISELASLRWSDVDMTVRTIRLTDERASARRSHMGSARRTKGRRDRTLPIHPDLYNVLVPMIRHRDGRIFHGPRGGLLKPDTVRLIFIEEVLTPLKENYPTPAGEIGFEHGRIHSFRHFFCSQAFLGGAAEADIRDWLGYADSKMVAHYRHLSAADSQRKMSQIDFLGQEARTVRVTG